MTADRRILIAEFDSIEQRRVHELYPATADSHLVGALRLATMLADRILLSDSMLLDSAFFSRIGPERLAAELGEPSLQLPITVLSASADLQDALNAKLDEPSFRWQLAGPERPAGWPDDDQRQRWHRWVQAQREGRIRLESFTSGPDGLVKPSFALDPIQLTEAEHDDPLLADFAASLQSAGGRRSLVENAYHAAVAHSTNDTFAGVQALRARWNVAYLDAMARQHTADWMRLTAAATESAGRERAHGRTVLRLSGTVIDLVRELPGPVFAQLTWVLREARAAYVAEPTPAHLRDLSYQVSSFLQPKSVRSVIRSALYRLGLATLGFGLATPIIQQAHWYQTNWAWLPFAAAVAFALPWGDLADIRSVTQTNLQGIISVDED